MRTMLSLVLLLSACNTAEPMGASRTTTPQTTSGDWGVEITSSGGFAGRGLGSVAISGAAVEATNMSATPCRGTLTDAERNELQRLVAAARPESWRDVPPPRGSADMVSYTLTLRRGDASQSVTWTGEDVAPLPRDLGALFEAAWKVRGRVCG